MTAVNETDKVPALKGKPVIVQVTVSRMSVLEREVQVQVSTRQEKPAQTKSSRSCPERMSQWDEAGKVHRPREEILLSRGWADIETPLREDSILAETKLMKGPIPGRGATIRTDVMVWSRVKGLGSRECWQGLG